MPPPPTYVDPPPVTPDNWSNPWDPPEFRAANEPALVGDPNRWTWVGQAPGQPAGGNADILWSNCRIITWAYNPDGGFDGSLAIMKRAVARIAGATGLRFKYVGTTTQVPLVTGYESDWLTYDPAGRAADIRIGWRPSGTKLGGGNNLQQGYLAIGGPTVMERHSNGTGAEIVGSDILLNSDHVATLSPYLLPENVYGVYQKYSWGATFMHELGHAVGLGHFDQSLGPVDTTKYPGASETGFDQIMSTSSLHTAAWFGATDIAGLARMGTNPYGHGC